MTVNSADGRNGFCRFCTLKEATQNGAKRRSVWQIFLYRKYQHKFTHSSRQKLPKTARPQKGADNISRLYVKAKSMIMNMMYSPRQI